MDHRGWLWRKKSSEKTIVSTNRLAIPLGTIEEEEVTSAVKTTKSIAKHVSRAVVFFVDVEFISYVRYRHIQLREEMM